MPHPENLVGYSLIIKGKVGRGKRPFSSSFLSRRHACIISSSSRLGRGVFLSLHGQARTVKKYLRSQYNEHLSVSYCFLCVQRACPRDHELTELTGQDVGLIPALFYCLGACLMFLLPGFVAKQACLVLWLSKPAFFFLFVFK